MTTSEHSTPERRPVVAGVDGSPAAIRAAVHAGEEAGRRSAPLLLVHVAPWAVAAATAPFPTPEIRELLEAGAAAVLREAADAVRDATGREAATRSLEGRPVDALRAVSAEAELLVLGSRGAGGVAGLLLGSTAAGVVGHAHCPVVVLPDELAATVRERRSVVAAVEGAPGDEEVLGYAFAAAAARGTDLVAVHAWRDLTLEVGRAAGTAGPDRAGPAAAEERLLAESLAGWREKEPDVPVREVVVRDRAVVALLGAALSAELLVLGHRQRGVLPRMGSTTYGVLHRASCPVAVVPLDSQRAPR